MINLSHRKHLSIFTSGFPKTLTLEFANFFVLSFSLPKQSSYLLVPPSSGWVIYYSPIVVKNSLSLSLLSPVSIWLPCPYHFTGVFLVFLKTQQFLFSHSASVYEMCTCLHITCRYMVCIHRMYVYGEYICLFGVVCKCVSVYVRVSKLIYESSAIYNYEEKKEKKNTVAVSYRPIYQTLFCCNANPPRPVSY